MTAQLKTVINLTKSLSFSEQLELLGALSDIIQRAHSSESQIDDKDEGGFSAESFQTSLKQAIDSETLPLSELWEESSSA